MIRKTFSLWLFIVALDLWGCGQPKPAASTSSVLHRALSGEPSSLDPALAADTFSQEVLRDAYEGLTVETPDGAVIPGVASSWESDSNGTQYTFRLRRDARWSNGKAVRAQDFVAAWRRVVDPNRASPVADDLRLLAGAADIIGGHRPAGELGVYAQSDDILVVKLAHPAPYLPQLLTHSAAFPVYSEESATSHDPKTWVSNGAYVLANWSPGTSAMLMQNAQYWDRSHVSIPGVDYQFVSDENAQFARYRAGQIDLTDSVPANALPELRRQHPTELVVAPFLATAYYGLNLTATPFARNVKLRQAVTMAVDRRRLADALMFGQVPAYGFVPEATANYGPQSWEWKNLDAGDRVAEAKRLYAEAGYSRAAPLHLRLIFNANPVIKNTAVIVAGMWKSTLGIDVELIEEEYRVFLQSRHDRSRWDVARLGWVADYDDASAFLDLFREDSTNNDVGYANRDFVTLLDEAARTVDPKDRRKMLEHGERIMLADYPVVPLYFFVSKRLVKPYVRGLRPTPLNRVESKSLQLLPH